MSFDLLLPLPLQPGSGTEPLSSGAVRIMEDALAILRERRGLDFAEYRRGTLERRLANRMTAARADGADAYLALLRTTEAEVDRLAANLTIKVSRFYRNAGVFDFLRERALPELRGRFPGEALRAWSAGCAGGEEAYTLAAILAGEAAPIVATDIDESALALARRGIYRADSFVEIPGELLNREFGETGEPGLLRVGDSLRKGVVFARHDLAAAQEPPVGAPFHLVSCRNVLIYFARPLQQRVLRLLVDSLVPGGLLCLGESEWPGEAASSLQVVDRSRKIFRRSLPEERDR
jgi:chemotaxis methyl-accepting protein methylase